MDPKAFVLDFRRRFYGVNEDGTQADELKNISKNLTNAIEQLSKGLYEKDVHFILELIQNAEDNSYEDVSPELRFVLIDNDPTKTPGADGCLCVLNNESGFSEANVESVSQIGGSTKSKSFGYIGEKGIGFKSVFVVSDRPHIYSNGFRIFFRETDPSIDLSYVVPYWADETPDIVSSERFTTAILLPLKPGKKEEIADELLHIRPETILFLKRLEGLSVRIESRGVSMELVRDVSRQPTIELLTHEGEADVVVDQYWIHSETVPVPSNIREEKRQDVVDRDITLAFPVDDTASDGTVFAFLPTEIASGLPFLINADFVLTANRESIQIGRRWNKWLRDEISSVVVRALKSMLSDPRLELQMYQYIPIPEDLKTLAAFFEPICQKVCQELSSSPVVAAMDGCYVLPSAARTVDAEFRTLFPVEGDRPEGFKEVRFVHPELEVHSKRLRAIGVKSITRGERLALLSDEIWNSRQPPDWFVAVFRYLQSSKALGPKESFRGLPLIPLESGELCSAGTARVYLREGGRTSQRKHRIGDRLPQLQFLNADVQTKLEEEPALLNWVCDKFDISPFSLTNYVEGTLVPWLDSAAEELSQQDLFAALRYICAGWASIDDPAIDRIHADIPVMLEDGVIQRRRSLMGDQLLTPRGLDKERGWQILLKESAEVEHHDVLSDEYLDLSPKGADLSEFLSAMGAEATPKLVPFDEPVRRLTALGFGEYFSHIAGSSPRSYTQTPMLESWAPPAFFMADSQRRNAKNRRALIAWLDAAVEKYPDEVTDGSIRWFYYSPQRRYVDSLLQYYLQRLPWIKTTQGLKAPVQTFRKSKQTRELFGNRLPYVDEKISPAVSEYLGIKAEATSDTIVDFLRDLSGTTNVELGTVIALYGYLSRFGKDYQEEFSEEPLIYVPGESGGWFTSEAVVWRDFSTVLPGVYGYLEPHYGSQDLRKFFVGSLKVSERVAAEELARAWIHVAQRDDLDQEQVESALEVIVSGVNDAFVESDGMPDWWDDFSETVQVWTRDDVFMDPEDVYVADDRILEGMFKDFLYFAWKPERLTYSDLAPMFDALGLTPISTSVDVALADLANPIQRAECEILTDYTKRLLACFIFNDSSDAYQEHMESGILPSVLRGVEGVTSELVLSYSVRDSGAEATRKRSAYWDDSNSVLYTSSDSDPDDVLDEVAEALARLFWRVGFRSAEDTIRALLQISTEGRFRKIRDKKGWHLPLEEQKRIQEHIDAVSQQVRDQEVEGDQIADTLRPVDRQPEETDHSLGAGKDESDGDCPSRDHIRPRGVRPAAGVAPTTEQTSTERPQGRPRRSAHENHLRPSNKSRSKEVTRKANSVVQSRIPVYVVAQDEAQGGAAAEELAQDRQAIGDAAEEWVRDQEAARGMAARRMPPGNPGYDIEAVDPATGETRFIEVKGLDGLWGARGVGLTSVQYQMALERGDAYWLYVVENARSHPVAYVIRDPARRVTEYRFDQSWATLAEGFGSGSLPSVEEIVLELKAFTDDSACQEIVELCPPVGIPVPEVGYEVFENDEVVGDVELAWPEQEIAIALANQVEAAAALTRSGWSVLSTDVALSGWPEAVSDFFPNLAR